MRLRSLLTGILTSLFLQVPILAGAVLTNVFLEIPTGPRSLAMGSTGLASPGGPFTSWWNPANLAFLNQSGVASSYALLDVGARAYDLRVALRPSAKERGYSFSWAQTNFNNVSQTEILLDASGAIIIDPNTGLPEKRVIGFARESDNLFSGSFGFSLRQDLAVGATGKTVYSTLGGVTGQGFGADLGLSWRSGRLSLGSIYRNIGLTRIEWTDGFLEQLPSGAQAEVAFQLGKGNGEGKKSLILALATWIPRTPEIDETSIRAGAEWRLSPALAFRFGFNGDRLTGGAGFRMKDLVGDYAFAPNREHHAVHRLAVSWLWGQKQETATPRSSAAGGDSVPRHLDPKERQRQ